MSLATIDILKGLLAKNPSPEQREAAACLAMVNMGLDSADAWHLIGRVAHEMSETSERDVIRFEECDE